MDFCGKIAVKLYLQGMTEKESVHMSRIILSQRRCYKRKNIKYRVIRELSDLYGNDNEWQIYNKQVRALTELNASKVKGIEKRGFRNYHLDHKVSVWYGYRNKIPAEIIASTKNLRMIPHDENLRKGVSVSEEHLRELGY